MTAFKAAIFTMALETVAADHPFVGTWKLNVAKSKINTGPPAKSWTVTFTAQENGLRLVGDGMEADGKDHPLTGPPDADTIVDHQNRHQHFCRSVQGSW